MNPVEEKVRLPKIDPLSFRRMAAATLLVWGIIFLFRFDTTTGFTRMIRFGAECAQPRLSEVALPSTYIKPHHPGYDGQFYAQIAIRPYPGDAELTQALDLPLYRLRRILLPELASITGAGSVAWTLQIYALLNPLCWLAFAWLMLHWFREATWKSFAGWLACVLGMGVLESIRGALVDLPAAVFMVVGLRGVECGRRWSAAFAMALGGLTRETILLACSMFAPPRWTLREMAQSALYCSLAALPILFWSLHLSTLYPQSMSGTHNLDWPFSAMIQSIDIAVQNIRSGIFDSGRYWGNLLAVVAFLTQWLCLLFWRDTKNSWWWVGLSFAALFPFLAFVVWEGYWAVARAILPMSIAFNVLFVQKNCSWKIFILGNLTVLHGLFRFAF